ncbi:hypothetical protein M1N24_01960 [Dehalococcoidia bacterium]|nr:hypothetical protein [Dehalococcoidia bacterium]
MNRILARMIGAALFKEDAYEEIENDRSATWQALLIVIVVAIVTGIGFPKTAGCGLFEVVVVALLGWVIWAWVIYLIGTRILKIETTCATWSQLARVLGFAQSAGILKILGFLPGVGKILFVVVTVFQWIAMTIAVRQALDYGSTWRAVGVALIAIVPAITLIGIAISI